MADKPLRAVLDSNILVSAYSFGGKPKFVLKLVIIEQIRGVISPALIKEFLGVLREKIRVSEEEISEIQNEIKNTFQIVNPHETLHIVRDDTDNRVLEAAIEGECDYIVTGDKDLLTLKKYKKIKIVTADTFIMEFTS